MLGFLKVILFIWIIFAVKRWYDRIRSGRRQPPVDRNVREDRIESPGGIEDAVFEDIDDDRRSS